MIFTCVRRQLSICHSASVQHSVQPFGLGPRPPCLRNLESMNASSKAHLTRQSSAASTAARSGSGSAATVGSDAASIGPSAAPAEWRDVSLGAGSEVMTRRLWRTDTGSREPRHNWVPSETCFP